MKNKNEPFKLTTAEIKEIMASDLNYNPPGMRCEICRRRYVFDEVVGNYVENCRCYDSELLPNGEER